MRSAKKEKLSVLMELRACLEGYSGIPQENRLIFRSLGTLDNVEVTGLINHGSRRLSSGLAPGFFGRPLDTHAVVERLSNVAISVKENPMESVMERVLRFVEKRLENQLLRFTMFGAPIKIYDFDAVEFGDFVWQQLFSKTLPASDYEAIQFARYATMRPPADFLHNVAIKWKKALFNLRSLPRLNTRRYDIFISQMPWPTLLAPNTLPVVRYHDAIPVFLPHTLGNARFCQATHLAGLAASRKRAVFVCNSSATQCDLLKIYPELESRSLVIYDTVSREYFEEKSNPALVVNCIRTHICPITEPKFFSSREKERFYGRCLMTKPLRFLLMVSQIQPRKNHAKLIAAWDYLKNHEMPDLKLVIVGELGWDFARLVESMAPAQERGELFHLHRVPPAQLRVLYREAAAVVCPSIAEGFDLTGIEAMLSGGAVVASNIPTHREIYGDACEYFNPYSVLDMAKGLQRVIAPEFAGRREELVRAGLLHGPRYRSENITPVWREFFERIRMGDFAASSAKMNFSLTAGSWPPKESRSPEPLVAARRIQQDHPADAVSQNSGGLLASPMNGSPRTLDFDESQRDN